MGFANDINYSGLTGLLAPLNGTPTKLEPADLLQGFVPGQPIAAQHINWICNKAISVVGEPVFGLGNDGDVVMGATDIDLNQDTSFDSVSWGVGAVGKIRTNGFRLCALVLDLTNAPAGAICGDGDPSAAETTYTQPGSHSFIVPAGVTSLTTTTYGGTGGRNTSGTTNARGGRGRVTGVIPVTPGETLTLVVAASGTDFSGNTTNSAGGGGCSMIKRGPLVLLLAGGGGGSGGTGYAGGAGGGTTGGAGAGSSGSGGGGGSQVAGGALGAHSAGVTTGGTAGTPFTGGLGGYQVAATPPFYAGNGGYPSGGQSGKNTGTAVSGAGGGQGYYGGGGGGSHLDSGTPRGGGGGGGSSYTDASVTGVVHGAGLDSSGGPRNGEIRFTGLATVATPNGLSGTTGWGQGGIAPGGAVTNYPIATGGRGGGQGGPVGTAGSGSVSTGPGTRDVSPLGPTRTLAPCGMAGASGAAAAGMPSSPSGGSYLVLRAALVIRDATTAASCISSRGGAGIKPTGTFAPNFGHGPGGGGGGVIDFVYGDITGPVIPSALNASGGTGGAGGNATTAGNEGAAGGEGGEGGKIFLRPLFTGETQRVIGLPGASGTYIANGGGVTGGAGGAGGACLLDL